MRNTNMSPQSKAKKKQMIKQQQEQQPNGLQAMGMASGGDMAAHQH